MKQNVAPVGPKAETHEGGRADAFQRPLEELTRAVSACLLFENTFYESGTGIAERIADLCGQVAPEDVSKLAIRARHDLKLRHVPLWLCAQLAKRHRGRLVSDTIQAVIRRPDEMGELIALYTGKKERGKPAHLNRSLRKGIARAYPRFDAYQLGKWNRDAAVTLRDVMFLCHPKPKDEAQAAVWKALIDKTLPAPDTWEVALSSGADKQATWTRLLTPDETGRRKLPYMARLMNLRNMIEAQVDLGLIRQALMDGAERSWALPFRFVTAAKHAPSLADALNDAMLLAIKPEPKLPGMTYIIVDVSGSMTDPLSAKSSMTRMEAAAALTVLLREVCASCAVFTFSNRAVEVPNHRGLPLIHTIAMSQLHVGTHLVMALRSIMAVRPRSARTIVVTDEQAHDGLIPPPAERGYLINVGPYQPALETGKTWTRFTGWSERIVDWMRVEEGLGLSADVNNE